LPQRSLSAEASIRPSTSIRRYDARIESRRSVDGSGFRVESEIQDVTGCCPFDVQLPQHLLVLTQDGSPTSVTARVDGKPIGRFDVRHGQLTILPLGQRLRGCTDGAGSRREVKVLVDPEFVGRIAGTDTDPSRVPFAHSFALPNPLIAQALAALGRELERPGPMHRLYTESLVVVAVAELIRHQSAGAEAQSTPEDLPAHRLRHLVAYMEEHLDQDLTLLKLADEARLSPATLARAFKRGTGRSVHQYLLTRRLECAATLLGGAQQSIAEIALATGFCSQSHLTTAFQRAYGTTPAAYRRREFR
jgi:AraC family transcriptional regulator